ncbi:MAG: beta-aspartyl-peptidase [Bacteroidetes bacterium]|nr:MAG: beta-aspartyl-peptidase [Bacteroidota bacterium]
MLKLIVNADCYAPESLGLKSILIAGGKIVYIGDSEPDLGGSLAVERTDVAGAPLVPGFIDPHAHITGGGGEAGYHTRVPSVLMSEYTRGGITTVVGLLGTDDLTRTTSSVIVQAKSLKNEGISCFCYTGGYHLPPTTLTGSVRSDIVHVEEIVGVGELAIADHRSSQPTVDELLRIASEAHVAGLMTEKAGVVHLHVGDGDSGLQIVRDALDQSELPPRVFYPTHVNRRKKLFEEACVLSQRGSTIDITAFPVADDEDAWSAANALIRYLDGDFPRENVTVSTDGGGCLPVFDESGNIESLDYARATALADTVKELLDRGQPLDRILPAFTSNTARILRLQAKGAVRVGYDADLVVLGPDHLPSYVMANGNWHLFNTELRRTGTFE